MKKTYTRCCLTVLLLISVDQLTKLLVKAFVPVDSLNSIIYTHSDSGWVMFHIHPELHDRYPLGVDIVIAVLAIVFMAAVIIYSKYERSALLRDIPNAEAVKTSPKLTKTALVLFCAGIISSTLIDSLIWGGSLDFLCLEWARFHVDVAEPYTVSYRYDCDLKDIFIIVSTALILVRGVIWQISLYKLPKSDRKVISNRELHFIRCIKELRGEPPKNINQKNSVFDILVLVFFTIFFCVAFGYVIYIFAVLVIIPVAVEVSPALNALLTKIGEENDTVEIYNTIRSFCLMVGVLPAVCGANTAVKYRERHFINDTNGMIVTIDGLRYHLRQHALYDVISLAVIVAICLLLYISGQWSISPFCFIYDRLGIPIALILSVVITAISQVFGIVFAQKTWRAEHFYSD